MSPSNSLLHLAWDSIAERPTLGGAIVLRQEAELLARARRLSTLCVHWDGDATGAPGALAIRLARLVFGASAFACEFTSAPSPADVWPTAETRRDAGFSYFSFRRLLNWHRRHGEAPRLAWSEETTKNAEDARRRFPGKLVCLHLKYASPFRPEDSNADPVAWAEFLRARARPGEFDFVLLGDDLPPGIAGIPGVSRAADAGIELGAQLCLVGRSNAFLGMASGVCTAANFSDVPHVIFKHPAHHPVEMERELDSGDRFPFATSRQRLWRREGNTAALHEALDLVLSCSCVRQT